MSDFHISQSGGTGARKKEGMQTLYSMLEYCEEPHQCRRVMLLKFMGESFNRENCNMMCDNCRADYDLEMLDVTKETAKIVECLEFVQYSRGKITTQKFIELGRGKAKATAWLKQDIISRYQGFLKQFSENEIKRIVIKLLLLNILEEVFYEQHQGFTVYLEVQPGAVTQMNRNNFKMILSKGEKKVDKTAKSQHSRTS